MTEEMPIEDLYEEKQLQIRQYAELAQLEVYSDGTPDTSAEVEKYRLICRTILQLHEAVKSLRGPQAPIIFAPEDLAKLEQLVGITEHMRTKLTEARGHRDQGDTETLAAVRWQDGAPPGLANPRVPPGLEIAGENRPQGER